MEVRRISADGGFIREYSDMKRRVRSLETSPTGTVVVRESVKTVDPETGVETVLGQLPDGSYGFQPFVGDTEPPPVATQPEVVASPGFFTVRWNGLFEFGLTQPRDFEHLNVVGYKITDGIPVRQDVVGVIRTAKDSLTVGTDVMRAGDTYAFKFISEDYNGNESSESLISAPVTMQDILSPVDEAWTDMLDSVREASEKAQSAQNVAADAQAAADTAIDDALRAIGAVDGKGKVIFSETAPGADDRNAQTLWIDTTGGANTPKRWTTGTTWVEVTDKKIVDAAAAASRAEQTANQAYNASVAASTAAGDAITAANGKNRNWHQTTAPTGVDHRDGDIWFDTDDGNKMYIWRSSNNTWTDIRDAGIETALTNSTTALTSANGKNKVIWSTENPSGTNYTVGDTWFKRVPDTGVILGQWEFNSSKVWVSRLVGNDVLAANIDAGKITAGFISSDRIRSMSISADKILVGSGANLAYNGSAEYPDTRGYNFERDTTDAPPGFTSSWKKYSPVSTSFNFLTNPGIRMKPFTTYKIKVWIKASVAGTKSYLEPMTGSTAAGDRTNPIYAFTNIDVPTTWTPITATITTQNLVNGDVYFRWFVNHANGTTQDATFWFSGFEIFEMNSGELIVDGSIKSNMIDAGQINAGHISSGSINASHIAAKSITSDKLVISSTDNLIMEADFSNGGSSWARQTRVTIVSNAGRSSMPALRFSGVATALTSLNLSNKIPVGQDDRFRGSIFYKTNSNLAAGAVSIRLRCYSSATAFTETTVIAQNDAETTFGTWKQISGISPSLPSGTIAVEFFLRVQNPFTTTVTDIDFVSVTKAFTGALIVDGAINGQRIIGATIETNASPTEGIKLGSSGLISHGNIIEFDPVGQVNQTFASQAILTTMRPAWSSFAQDTVPGLFFTGKRADGSQSSNVPPAVPAGIVASNGLAQGITMQSSQQVDRLDYRTAITADQNYVFISAQGFRTTESARPRQTVQVISNTGWYTQTTSETGVVEGSMGHNSGGSVYISAANNLRLDTPKITTNYGASTTSAYRVPVGILSVHTLAANDTFTTTKKSLQSFSVRGEKDSHVLIQYHIHGYSRTSGAYAAYTLNAGSTEIKSYTKPYANANLGDTTVFVAYYKFTANTTVTFTLYGQVVVTTATVVVNGGDVQAIVQEIGGATTF